MAKTLISTPLNITTSDTAVSTVDITSGIDNTYPVYEFHFVNIHPSGLYHLTFQVDTGTNTSYNQPIQSTRFDAYHTESGSSATITYQASYDQAIGDQAFQMLADYIGGSTSVENEASASGILTLYDPSNTTYVKHFNARFANAYQEAMAFDHHTAGYINTSTAITRIRFKMSSGNIDAGTIKMFGVS
tara:strand:- start:671 stop:1234 length:564 start_codon:yes stop_codon:yes gene_type:complete